ncbi:MAG: hypothetical protein WBZ14_12505 [Terriglobales bacterium]|jgi:hypothetical protein
MDLSPIDCTAVTDFYPTFSQDDFIADASVNRRRRKGRPMNRLFTTLILLGCVSFSFGQGLQGKATLTGSSNIVTGHSVTLTWNASANATSYNLYRATASGGPYVQVASGIVVPTYTDTQVGHSQTLYYVATAVQGTSESGYSNQAVAVIP